MPDFIKKILDLLAELKKQIQQKNSTVSDNFVRQKLEELRSEITKEIISTQESLKKIDRHTQDGQNLFKTISQQLKDLFKADEILENQIEIHFASFLQKEIDKDSLINTIDVTEDKVKTAFLNVPLQNEVLEGYEQISPEEFLKSITNDIKEKRKNLETIDCSTTEGQELFEKTSEELNGLLQFCETIKTQLQKHLHQNDVNVPLIINTLNNIENNIQETFPYLVPQNTKNKAQQKIEALTQDPLFLEVLKRAVLRSRSFFFFDANNIIPVPNSILDPFVTLWNYHVQLPTQEADQIIREAAFRVIHQVMLADNKDILVTLERNNKVAHQELVAILEKEAYSLCDLILNDYKAWKDYSFSSVLQSYKNTKNEAVTLTFNGRYLELFKLYQQKGDEVLKDQVFVHSVAGVTCDLLLHLNEVFLFPNLLEEKVDHYGLFFFETYQSMQEMLAIMHGTETALAFSLGTHYQLQQQALTYNPSLKQVLDKKAWDHYQTIFQITQERLAIKSFWEKAFTFLEASKDEKQQSFFTSDSQNDKIFSTINDQLIKAFGYSSSEIKSLITFHKNQNNNIQKVLDIAQVENHPNLEAFNKQRQAWLDSCIFIPKYSPFDQNLLPILKNAREILDKDLKEVVDQALNDTAAITRNLKAIAAHPIDNNLKKNIFYYLGGLKMLANEDWQRMPEELHNLVEETLRLNKLLKHTTDILDKKLAILRGIYQFDNRLKHGINTKALLENQNKQNDLNEKYNFIIALLEETIKETTKKQKETVEERKDLQKKVDKDVEKLFPNQKMERNFSYTTDNLFFTYKDNDHFNYYRALAFLSFEAFLKKTNDADQLNIFQSLFKLMDQKEVICQLTTRIGDLTTSLEPLKAAKADAVSLYDDSKPRVQKIEEAEREKRKQQRKQQKQLAVQQKQEQRLQDHPVQPIEPEIAPAQLRSTIFNLLQDIDGLETTVERFFEKPSFTEDDLAASIQAEETLKQKQNELNQHNIKIVDEMRKLYFTYKTQCATVEKTEKAHKDALAAIVPLEEKKKEASKFGKKSEAYVKAEKDLQEANKIVRDAEIKLGEVHKQLKKITENLADRGIVISGQNNGVQPTSQDLLSAREKMSILFNEIQEDIKSGKISLESDIVDIKLSQALVQVLKEAGFEENTQIFNQIFSLIRGQYYNFAPQILQNMEGEIKIEDYIQYGKNQQGNLKRKEGKQELKNLSADEISKFSQHLDVISAVITEFSRLGDQPFTYEEANKLFHEHWETNFAANHLKFLTNDYTQNSEAQNFNVGCLESLIYLQYETIEYKIKDFFIRHPKLTGSDLSQKIAEIRKGIEGNLYNPQTNDLLASLHLPQMQATVTTLIDQPQSQNPTLHLPQDQWKQIDQLVRARFAWYDLDRTLHRIGGEAGFEQQDLYDLIDTIYVQLVASEDKSSDQIFAIIQETFRKAVNNSPTLHMSEETWEELKTLICDTNGQTDLNKLEEGVQNLIGLAAHYQLLNQLQKRMPKNIDTGNPITELFKTKIGFRPNDLGSFQWCLTPLQWNLQRLSMRLNYPENMTPEEVLKNIKEIIEEVIRETPKRQMLSEDQWETVKQFTNQWDQLKHLIRKDMRTYSVATDRDFGRRYEHNIDQLLTQLGFKAESDEYVQIKNKILDCAQSLWLHGYHGYYEFNKAHGDKAPEFILNKIKNALEEGTNKKTKKAKNLGNGGSDTTWRNHELLQVTEEDGKTRKSLVIPEEKSKNTGQQQDNSPLPENASKARINSQIAVIPWEITSIYPTSITTPQRFGNFTLPVEFMPLEQPLDLTNGQVYSLNKTRVVIPVQSKSLQIMNQLKQAAGSELTFDVTSNYSSYSITTKRPTFRVVSGGNPTPNTPLVLPTQQWGIKGSSNAFNYIPMPRSSVMITQTANAGFMGFVVIHQGSSWLTNTAIDQNIAINQWADAHQDSNFIIYGATKFVRDTDNLVTSTVVPVSDTVTQISSLPIQVESSLYHNWHDLCWGKSGEDILGPDGSGFLNAVCRLDLSDMGYYWTKVQGHHKAAEFLYGKKDKSTTFLRNTPQETYLDLLIKEGILTRPEKEENQPEAPQLLFLNGWDQQPQQQSTSSLSNLFWLNKSNQKGGLVEGK